MKQLKMVILLGGMMILSANPLQAGDILYFDGFRMFADRSTLMIELGNYQGKFAMKLSFGHGLTAKYVGIVFKEGLDESNAKKIDTAVGKLSEMLNNPKTTILRTEKELSTDLGLTFDKFVNGDQIK